MLITIKQTITPANEFVKSFSEEKTNSKDRKEYITELREDMQKCLRAYEISKAKLELAVYVNQTIEKNNSAIKMVHEAVIRKLSWHEIVF